MEKKSKHEKHVSSFAFMKKYATTTIISWLFLNITVQLIVISWHYNKEILQSSVSSSWFPCGEPQVYLTCKSSHSRTLRRNDLSLKMYFYDMKQSSSGQRRTHTSGVSPCCCAGVRAVARCVCYEIFMSVDNTGT